jgi:Methyltransferase domain
MTAGPIRVSSDWLALREPADAAARASDLAEHVARGVPETGGSTIHDLGCGTGAMSRWLAPRLPGRQHWVMHDRDADLLEVAAAHLPAAAADRAPVTVETRHSDITCLAPGDLAGASLITASALLDMMTADELAVLVTVCAGAGCPVLFTLSVVGRVALMPHDPLDLRVAAAFNDHQRRATERGRLLGPDAVAFAVGEFRRLGGEVLVRASPWRLGAANGDLAAEWFTGWVAAACEQEIELGAETEVYTRRRLAQAKAGKLAATVAHEDVLMLPWSARGQRDVERVRATACLRRQISGVRGGQMHARRHPRGHGHSEAAELPGLVGVIAEQRDPEHAECLQHLRRDPVAAFVLAVPEREVRLIGVESRVL